MDLVVHEVQQLQDVRHTDRDQLRVGLTVPPVEQLRLADVVHQLLPVLAGVRAAERREDLVLLGAVEDGRRDMDRPGVIVAVLVESDHRGVAEVGLEHLSQVHARRDAERVQDDVHRRAVFEERHVFLGQDRGDHALVAVPAGELVTVRDLPLLRDVHPYELVHARRQLVAVIAVEHADADHLAGLAVRDLERGVADLARLLPEDRTEEPLLGGELRLALRRDLARRDSRRG